MMKKVTSLILCLLLLPIVTAWTWDQHTGITQWKVTVTEDESGCGGGRTNQEYAIAIQHAQNIADVGNWGHGKTRGAFTGNKLSFPGRTIPDGEGASRLQGFDLTFTPDCMSFSGGYRWDYADAYMRCSGTTVLRGTRADGKECPGAAERTEEQKKEAARAELASASASLAAARKEIDGTKQEKDYRDLLAKNPKDFWANWDMAALKKKQGNYKEFFDYLDTATKDKNIYPETRKELMKGAVKDLHLNEPPTTANSLFLKSIVQDDLNKGNAVVYGVHLKKDPANPESYLAKLREAYRRKVREFVTGLANN